MQNTTRARIAGLVGTIGAIALAGGVVFAAGSSSKSEGPDNRYGASVFDDATARVHVVHAADGGTVVVLQVNGVNPAAAGNTYGAHVHTSPCGTTGAAAGGHYQHTGITGPLEGREIWLDFRVNPQGYGRSQAWRPWSLDESTPRSVIIHAAPTNPQTGAADARLACINLDGVTG